MGLAQQTRSPVQSVKTSQKRIIRQGEMFVSNSENDFIYTVLGSCVGACLYCVDGRGGGMNHFLLPVSDEGNTTKLAQADAMSLMHGGASMERLINALLKRGIARCDLRCKLFGGARVLDQKTGIGRLNIAFAEEFLKTEKIPIVSKNVGGLSPRQVRFWPVSGRVQLKTVRADAPELIAPPPPPPEPAGNEVELF